MGCGFCREAGLPSDHEEDKCPCQDLDLAYKAYLVGETSEEDYHYGRDLADEE